MEIEQNTLKEGREQNWQPDLKPLTGLRFFAAISVVIYHFAIPLLSQAPGPVLQIAGSGYSAVSFFFVLSGFILSFSYLKAGGKLRGGRRDFYIARLARIYPAYLLAFFLALPHNVAASLHAHAPVAAAGRLLASALAALSLQQAWTPWTAWCWNFPAWSVSVEVFFYLVFPWIGPVLARLRLAWSLKLAGGLWVLCMIAPSVLFLSHGTTGAPELNDYLQMFVEFNPLLRLPEFLIGILLGSSYTRGLSSVLTSRSNLGRWLPYASVAAIISVLACSAKIPHPLLANGLLVPLFACLILSLTIRGSLLAKFLSLPAIVVLGEASYGIYILQMPVAYLMGAPSPHRSIAVFALYLVTLLIAALLSWRFVELPLRKLIRSRLMRPARPSGYPGPSPATSEFLSPPPGEAAQNGYLPQHVQRDLLSGTSALGIGVIAERGCSFIANILAARIGGAAGFGVYALAISTANSVSTYAAGGIGSTAIRFSGEHPRGSAGYSALTRVLAIISVASALLATSVLWLGARPIARLLHKESLTGALQWAALSAAGIILLECCRGFLVGQRRIKALLLLSGLVGAGYLFLLPAMARLGPVPMIASQSVITIGAVCICLLLFRSLGLSSPESQKEIQNVPKSVTPLLKQVWGFGIVQLAGLMGMNAAGWWLTSLIARSDSSMAQMGFFAIAHQLRNIVALAPSLLNEGSLAVMASPKTAEEKTPDNVMALCTYATTLMSVTVAGVGIILVPWLLKLLYGPTYSAAELVTAIALGTAVVHMGSAPVAARLSIVSIKASGIISSISAVFIAVLATLTLLNGGNAAKGAAVYLAGHILTAILQIRTLQRRVCVPKGTVLSFVYGTACGLSLAAMAWARELFPNLQNVITLGMVICLGATLWVFVLLGKRRGWLPSNQTMRSLFNKVLRRQRIPQMAVVED